MKLQRFTICFFLLLLVAAGAFAQGTTGALTGTVTQAGANLPGVTVTIASPTLQGTRTTVTNGEGDYAFPAIPPGAYKVTFSLSGLADVVKNTQVRLVETQRLYIWPGDVADLALAGQLFGPVQRGEFDELGIAGRLRALQQLGQWIADVRHDMQEALGA